MSIIWIISSSKGVSAEYLKEQAKRRQEEEARRRREARDAALTTQKQKHHTSSSILTSSNPHDGSRKDSSPLKVCQVRVKADIVSISSQPLSTILNIPKVLSVPHTPGQIGNLWNAYHMSRSRGTGCGLLCASIPLDLYKKMSAVAEKYPTFVIPICRTTNSSVKNGSAYEFYFLQWCFYDAPKVPRINNDHFVKPPSFDSLNPKISTVLFTPLEEYKLRGTFAIPYLVLTNYTDLASTHGVVLLRGEVTPRRDSDDQYMLSQEDAQQLSMAMQKFYLWDNGEGEGEKLLKNFHHRPQEFKWEELLKVADWKVQSCANRLRF